MRVTSIFAASVRQAMDEARRKLGPDAMLIRARRAPAENRHLGAFEVVFGLPGGSTAGKPAPSPPSATQDQQIAAIRKQMDELRALLDRTAADVNAEDPGGEPKTPVTEPENLLPSLDPALQEAIERLAQPGFGPSEQRQVAAFVGPPASGKTATVLKLAAKSSAMGRRPLIISFGDFRLAAHGVISRYASAFKVPCLTADSTAELRRAIEQSNDHDLVLIDTPGYGAAEEAAAEDLAAFLADREDVSTQLVLVAHHVREVQQPIVDRFRCFHPVALVFTHLDETSAFETAFSTAMENNLPISYLGCGQHVPEDILPAAERTLRQLLEDEDAVRIACAA